MLKRVDDDDNNDDDDDDDDDDDCMHENHVWSRRCYCLNLYLDATVT